MANIYDLSDTWNDGGTTFNAIKMDVTDTASAAGSRLLDLQVGGASKFYVRKDGTFGNETAWLNKSSTGVFRVGSATNDGRGIIGLRTIVGGSGFYGFSSDNSIADESDYDVALFRDAAETLAQRRGTNAQTFNIYNTHSDGSNYERARLGWSGNVFEIAPEAAGTGTTRVLHISGLPTANPGPGILWNDAGTVKVGT